jgi:hypothetical protein
MEMTMTMPMNGFMAMTDDESQDLDGGSVAVGVCAGLCTGALLALTIVGGPPAWIAEAGTAAVVCFYTGQSLASIGLTIAGFAS